MNFKKFNGTIWETVQHKVYGSGTDSLTAFPAMIQASGEPLTDYLISGNTIQSGTPTPEAPVDVVGCGVWDETRQSYKLPPTVNGTEHPIYLGQVESTRRIRKLVLTGEENNWGEYTRSDSTTVPYLPLSDFKGASATNIKADIKCTHYDTKTQVNIQNSTNKTGIAGRTSIGIIIADESISTLADFKSYLAAQYAAGTPVTVWYVLAEPETGIVNEPLHKIGSYTDTITMAQAEVAIPTSDGDNIISFGTTVQPSAMSATFKGWHPVQAAKQYDGNDWS